MRRLLIARGALALLSGTGALALAAATTWWFTNLSERCDYPDECLSMFLPQGQAVVGPMWSMTVALAALCCAVTLALVTLGQGRVSTWLWTGAATCTLWTAGRLAPGLGIGNPADRVRGQTGSIAYRPFEGGPWERLALYPSIWAMLAAGVVLLVVAAWSAQRLVGSGAPSVRSRYSTVRRSLPLRRINVPRARRIPPAGPLV